MRDVRLTLVVARYDLVVVGELAVDEPDRHLHVAAPHEHHVVGEAQRNRPFSRVLQQSPKLRQALPRYDHPLGQAQRPYIPLHQRQPVAVGRNHAHAGLTRFVDQGAVEVRSGLVRRDGENRLVDHLLQDMGRTLLALLVRALGKNREFLRVEADHLEHGLAAADLHPVVVQPLQLDGLLGELADDLEQLPRVHRNAPGGDDLAVDACPDSHLEIGGGDPNPVGVGLDQHVGQDRHRVAPFHRSLGPGQRAQEVFSFGSNLHLSSWITSP